MSDHRLEQLAVQLAAMSDEARQWVLVRMKDLLKMRREVGRRLSGKRENRLGRLVAGGLLFDADGNAIARVHSVSVRTETGDVGYHLHPLQVNEPRVERITIEITAHPMEEK